MTLEERIQRLEDIESIRYLQAKYQRLLDCRDFNGLAECFADDVVSAYGNGEMSYSGKDNVIKFLMATMSLDMPSGHFIHGGEIDVDGDTAKAKWYLQDFLIYQKKNINIHGAAVYDNDYVKENGVWLIKKIGYKRSYEYMDGVSQTQAATLKKTTYFDEIKQSNPDELEGYNKIFRESISSENK